MIESPSTAIGRCLCGTVRFEVTLPTTFCAHCHCTMCQRNHGAGYVTWFGVPPSRLRVTEGEGGMVDYRSSSHGTRSFCGRCGSSLFCRLDESDDVDVVLAAMEGPIDRKPEMHVHWGSRSEWVEIADSLPRLGGKTGMEPV